MALDAAFWSNRSLHSLHLPVEVSPIIVPAIRIVVGGIKLVTILIGICVVLGVVRSMTLHQVGVTIHKRVKQGALLAEIRTKSWCQTSGGPGLQYGMNMARMKSIAGQMNFLGDIIIRRIINVLGHQWLVQSINIVGLGGGFLEYQSKGLATPMRGRQMHQLEVQLTSHIHDLGKSCNIAS